MSSLLARYRQVQAQIKSLESEIQEIEKDPEFLVEKEFYEKLQQLMADYNKTTDQVVAYLLPEAAKESSKGTRGPRPGTPRKRLKYMNPHTGEVVVSASGNHKVLRGWRENYPDVDIKDWIVAE